MWPGFRDCGRRAGTKPQATARCRRQPRSRHSLLRRHQDNLRLQKRYSPQRDRRHDRAFDAVGVTQPLTGLGALGAKMKPANVPRLSSERHAVRNAALWTRTSRLAKDPTWPIRVPRFGWLKSPSRRGSAQRLGTSMMTDAANAAPA